MSKRILLIVIVAFFLGAGTYALVYFYQRGLQIQDLGQPVAVEQNSQAQGEEQSTTDSQQPKAVTNAVSKINGKVESIDEKSIVIKIGETTLTETLNDQSYVLITKDGKTEKGKMSDVKVGDDVFLDINTGNGEVISIQLGGVVI